MLLAALAIAAGNAHAVDTALTAVRASDPRVVDGVGTEWIDELRQLGDAAIEAAAVVEDSTLVVCVVFTDPTQRNQLMARGLELAVSPSLDPDGKVLGYPVGAVRPGSGGERPTERPDASAIRAAFDEQVDTVEWRPLNGDAFPTTRDALDAVEVAAGPGQGVFAYEVRIPLAHGTWGANVAGGETVVLTLKSPRGGPGGDERPSSMRRGGGRGMGNGSSLGGGGGMRGGGMGGGPRGGGGGRGGGERTERPDPIEVVLEIELPHDWR